MRAPAAKEMPGAGNAAVLRTPATSPGKLRPGARRREIEKIEKGEQ